MLDYNTISKLNELKLRKMAKSFQEQINAPSYEQLSFEERFGLIVDSEWVVRRENRLKALVRQANLREPSACIENIDYASDRKLDKSMILRLSTCSYITDAFNIIITGMTGAGKSYLSCAFGNSACRNRFLTLYIRLPDLLLNLSIARGDGSYKKYISQLKKVKLLILDDWGLAKLDMTQSRDILELMEVRYQHSSTIFSSQVPVDKWHALFADSTIADAVLDRVVHNAYIINIDGKDSMRKIKANRKD